MSQTNIQIMCLLTGQACPVNADFFDQNGNPFVPTGIPTWTSDNPASASVAPAGDGLSATITGLALGETFIRIHADGEQCVLCIRVGNLSTSNIVLNFGV